MSNVKLAMALLRRKELQEKVNILKGLKDLDIYEIKVKRTSVTDNIDDIVARVPKLTAKEVTAEYDWHARQLRLIDAAIQQANWTTDVEVEDSVMRDYEPKQ